MCCNQCSWFFLFIIVVFFIYNAACAFVKNKCEKRKNNTLLRNSVHCLPEDFNYRKFPQKKLWFLYRKLRFP
ncbi:hypothetical protein DR768_10930 [Salmonella enterica]|uniref:Uncharacterized protein n=2 Tax=Salmonella enterica TaxID=28901 RepID=A0A5T8C1L4_SALER|nr:hypothetical protein [Salmonella enterica]EBW0111164.1 hypothetical protein [Salmonella enterica subsp. enterica serovar Bareilly]EBY3115793.1 hypothetical protein [Salmonella enterica subsp. enterica serovar Molade]ECA4966987.1 hypothetical protein [Salmonella enterica subsp. enterica serovar Jukestown]ECC9613648.1 hypothetical protein [Salmonella enterica subsp. enterica]EDM1284665.1 hypothetical protein [Salmonella enterica subsp. enterica serovar Give]EDX2020063.1 hypothetical protein 